MTRRPSVHPASDLLEVVAHALQLAMQVTALALGGLDIGGLALEAEDQEIELPTEIFEALPEVVHAHLYPEADSDARA